MEKLPTTSKRMRCYCNPVLFVFVALVVWGGAEKSQAAGEETFLEDEDNVDTSTMAEMIRDAIASQLETHVEKVGRENVEKYNKTISYYLVHKDTASIRLGIGLAFVLLVLVMVLWCVCVAIKSAFKWLVNIVLALAAVLLFFLILEYLSVYYSWFSGTAFSGTTNVQ